MFGAAAVPVQHVWHFWLAVPLAALTALVLIGTVAMYFFKVTKTRYPQK
jgi:hypothetical protein